MEAESTSWDDYGLGVQGEGQESQKQQQIKIRLLSSTQDEGRSKKQYT